MNFIYSLQSEWLKTKRSAASWICLLGSFFIPAMLLFGSIVEHTTINDYDTNIWQSFFNQSWKFMGLALLPMGVIVASSLITQTEYKNNTWKQLYTTPQSYSTIFFAKLSAIFLMTIKFFIFFNIGILVAATIPTLLLRHSLPKESIPLTFFLQANAKIFLTCLPVIATQYLLGLRFKNFLVSIGVGLLLWAGSLILIQTWKHAYLSPYSYSPLIALGTRKVPGNVNIFLLAVIYFIVITAISYFLYRTKKDKG
jgi:hypothetical protein